ncbi:MAG: sulfurtransferase/chromate resistance protein [Sphingomonas bacterium]
MPAINAISPDKLVRLIGTPGCPPIIDLRSDVEIAADPGSIPGSRRRSFAGLAEWAADYAAQTVVVTCRSGDASSHGAAAWLRQAGADAELLEGGFAGWAAAGLPLVNEEAVPPRDAAGRTLWVTRARPKVDRIACPWLIRRFIDPDALFLFVAASEIAGVAARMGATPFDIEGAGVRWSHRGALCTFDAMIEDFGLGGFDGLVRLAPIVRGADTARPELAPEAAGLLAVSLGLSRMFADDLAQLEAGITVYDALYRWCRDATAEMHDWVSHTPAKGKAK